MEVKLQSGAFLEAAQARSHHGDEMNIRVMMLVVWLLQVGAEAALQPDAPSRRNKYLGPPLYVRGGRLEFMGHDAGGMAAAGRCGGRRAIWWPLQRQVQPWNHHYMFMEDDLDLCVMMLVV